MDKLQQLDQEIELKKTEILWAYKVKDISCDTCNMLLENLKNYYDKKRERLSSNKD